MAKINSHLFQAAANIHQGLIAHATLPQDPQHTADARYMAEELWKACHEDPIQTLAASRVLCGFMANKGSSHCTPAELVNHAIRGVQDLIRSFTPVQSTAMRVPSGPAQEPQTAPPVPVPMPVPSFPEPVTPLEVPDFT